MSYLVTAESLRGEALPDDGRALDLADWAEEYVERETGFRFSSHVTAYTLDGNGQATLTLPQPVISLTSVTVGGTAMVEGTDYVAMKRRPPGPDDRRWPRLIIPPPTASSSFLSGATLAGVWTKGVQNVVVTGTFGYTRLQGTAEVPPREIQRAALRLVALELARIGDDKESTARRIKTYVTSFTASALTTSLSELAVSAGPTHVPEIDDALAAFRHPTNAARPVFAFGGV